MMIISIFIVAAHMQLEGQKVRCSADNTEAAKPRETDSKEKKDQAIQRWMGSKLWRQGAYHRGKLQFHALACMICSANSLKFQKPSRPISSIDLYR